MHFLKLFAVMLTNSVLASTTVTTAKHKREITDTFDCNESDFASNITVFQSGEPFAALIPKNQSFVSWSSALCGITQDGKCFYCKDLQVDEFHMPVELLPCVVISTEGKNDDGTVKLAALSTGDKKEEIGLGLEAGDELVGFICG
ncbi:hypothetical protein OHC33_002429 [Knufia fluminis]|uniref:Uncharacterized protein n=2 Tax=Knufia TaxID=430999 RepID=A0AAN8EVI6_9EURO|nr:hypothetical protein OHC33_002429 [Knufia fluminis]